VQWKGRLPLETIDTFLHADNQTLTDFGEETTTLGNRRERTRQTTPCTSLAPDFPMSPGKIRPIFYPTAWFRGKLPGRSVRRPQSFADSLLRLGLADRGPRSPRRWRGVANFGALESPARGLTEMSLAFSPGEKVAGGGGRIRSSSELLDFKKFLLYRTSSILAPSCGSPVGASSRIRTLWKNDPVTY
jgi:hypothetical protein